MNACLQSSLVPLIIAMLNSEDAIHHQCATRHSPLTPCLCPPAPFPIHLTPRLGAADTDVGHDIKDYTDAPSSARTNQPTRKLDRQQRAVVCAIWTQHRPPWTRLRLGQEFDCSKYLLTAADPSQSGVTI
jgi:hypothetical protein